MTHVRVPEHDPHCPTRWLMECQCYLIRRVREDMQYRIDALETRLRMLAEEEALRP